MNKMNLYKLIEQQYKDYKKVHSALLAVTCDGCPCKVLRNEIINPYDQTDCTGDIMYLSNKYNVHDFNIFSCNSCMRAAVRIAKKIFGKEFNKI